MQLQEASRSIKMMGTTIDLFISVFQKAEWVLDQLVEQLNLYNHRFSANDDSSELMAINKQAGVQAVKVHPELYELIKMGKKHGLAERSLLNIAIGPLVQTWRIGFDDAKIPSDETIQKQLQLTNPHDIELNDAEQTVFLKHKGMQIDLGALAKGYIADRLIDKLDELNVQSALINLGGNLVTFGPQLKRPDLLWRIGIQNPVKTRGQSQLILKVPNKSVVTSGIYERKLEKNGQAFHHIFDPKTGYPVDTNLASLTIVSDLSVDGEIWTTRLFGLSPHEIMDTINETPHIDGLVILQNGELIMSEGLKKYL